MVLTKNDIGIINDLMDEKIYPLKTDISTLKTDVAVIKEDISELKADNLDIKDNLRFIQENMVGKEDLKNFLTKDEAKKIFLTKDEANDLAHYTANLVMEKMQDQFKLFNDKTLFIDGHIKDHRKDIDENKEITKLNAMKILHNSNRITVLEKAK